MDNSEMVIIANTPTLVAEENINHAIAKVVVKKPIQKIEPRRSSQNEKLLRDRLPVAGETFTNDKGVRYILKQKLGDGAMGHVFLTSFDNKTVAIKTEKFSTGMLPMEIKVTIAAQRNKATHFCQVFDYGSVGREYNFMVITLLGKDLYRLRSEISCRAFSLNTTTKIAIQTLEAIEELHSLGYLSRDVKPSNFAPGCREISDHRTIFMFDFGLAKKYLDRENRKLKSRGEVGWRGTIRYGSLNAHKRMDLGRCDDVECWFYMLVEMHVGEVPWRLLTDRNAVGNSKRSIREEGREKFFSRLPAQFEKILGMIDAYHFETRPEYRKIKSLIQEIRAENNLSDRQGWDWQSDESQFSELTETTSVMSDVAILAEQGATNYTDRQHG